MLSAHPLADGREHWFDRRGAGLLSLTLTPAAAPCRSAQGTLEALLSLLRRDVDLERAAGAEATLFLAQPLCSADLLQRCAEVLPRWRVGAAVGALSDPHWPLALRVRVPQMALKTA